MAKVEKATVYFDKPGSEQTSDVLSAVERRLKEGDVKTVVLASTSGATGVSFARVLKGKAELVVISHEVISSKNKAEIEGLGGKAYDRTHLPLHGEGMDNIRKSFYSLGQGFKVAVEVVLIAADKGVIKPYIDVIGVGGTGRGSDTAIVTRASTTKEALGDNRDRKLEIREVLAMPLQKKWW